MNPRAWYGLPATIGSLPTVLGMIYIGSAKWHSFGARELHTGLLLYGVAAIGVLLNEWRLLRRRRVS